MSCGKHRGEGHSSLQLKYAVVTARYTTERVLAQFLGVLSVKELWSVALEMLSSQDTAIILLSNAANQSPARSATTALALTAAKKTAARLLAIPLAVALKGSNAVKAHVSPKLSVVRVQTKRVPLAQIPTSPLLATSQSALFVELAKEW